MTRKSMLILALVLVAFLALDKIKVSTAEVEISEGKIGDVKYSVLDPSNFIKINGKGWVLMDGEGSWVLMDGEAKVQKPFKDSDLARFLGMNGIPDARGVFIRGLDLGRPDQQGDPDGKTRFVGSYQSDMIIDHRHKTAQPKRTERSVGWGDDRYNHVIEIQETEPPTNTRTGDNVPPISGVETRPRNIALYTYIKINN